MPDRYTHSGKQIKRYGEQFADCVDDDTAERVCLAMQALESRNLVVPRNALKRLYDAEEILTELCGVFAGYAKLHAGKGTPEGDQKAKRNTAFALLIQDFLAQGGCTHDHQVTVTRDSGVSSMLCLGCGQTRMEFFG